MNLSKWPLTYLLTYWKAKPISARILRALKIMGKKHKNIFTHANAIRVLELRSKTFFSTISHGFMIIIHTLDSTFRAFFYTSRERPINSANDFLSNLEFIFIKVKKKKAGKKEKKTVRQSDLLIESPSWILQNRQM